MRLLPLLTALALTSSLAACGDDKKDGGDKKEDGKKSDGPKAFDGPLTPELVASVKDFQNEVMSMAMDYKGAQAMVESKIGKVTKVIDKTAWWALMDADGKTCHAYALTSDGGNQIASAMGPSKMTKATYGYKDCVTAAGGKLEEEKPADAAAPADGKAADAAPPADGKAAGDAKAP